MVLRHAFDGQRAAAERVRQQPVQGLHRAPSAFPRCLHDTRLQPTDLLMNLLAVNGMPVHLRLRGCTTEGAPVLVVIWTSPVTPSVSCFAS